MKLSLQTKSVIETTVTPPIFWRHGNEYRGLLSDNDYREFAVIDTSVFIKVNPASFNIPQIQTAFLEWEQINEETFMDRYNEVLKSISLSPKLQP